MVILGVSNSSPKCHTEYITRDRDFVLFLCVPGAINVVTCKISNDTQVNIVGNKRLLPPPQFYSQSKFENPSRPLSIHMHNVYLNKRDLHRGFSGDAVVKNPPANAGDVGSSPGLGTSHMPQSN